MNIVIFVSYTYPFIGSGLGQVAIHQAEELSKLGHGVVLVSADYPSVKKKTFMKKGVLHIKLACINYLMRFHIPVPFFLINSKVLTQIKNADIIHSHDMLYPHSFQAAILALIFRKKFILTQHVGFIEYENKFINVLQWLVSYTVGRFVILASDKIIIVNEELKRAFSANSSKIVTLVNGVDINFFKPTDKLKKKILRRKYGLPLDKAVILFVGRLVPKKGYKLLIGAKNEEYIILFAGGGNIPYNLSKNKNNVLFLGNLPQNKLREIYQASDIFVLPSKSEGLPLSIQEAMASGLPIITCNNPGYNRYFNKPGVLFVKPDTSLLKQAIKDVLGDKILMRNMSRYSLSCMAASVSWKNNTDKLLGIYQDE